MVFPDKSLNVSYDVIFYICNVLVLQVAPAELEALLLSHPNIVDAAIIPCVCLIKHQIIFFLTSSNIFTCSICIYIDRKYTY